MIRRLLIYAAAAVLGQSLFVAPAIAKSTTRSCSSVTVGHYKATNVRATRNLGCKAAVTDLRLWLKQSNKLPHNAKSWHSKLVHGTWQMAYGRGAVSLWFTLVKVTPPKPTPPTPPTPPAHQTITITSALPARPTAGDSYTVTATGGASGNPVVFSIDPATTAGACSISGATVKFLTAGTCKIDANQAGNAYYNAAPEVSQSVKIANALQTIAITSTTNPVVGGSYTVVANASSGLPVSLSIDSSSKAGACSLNGATVSFTGGGACVIDANQAGNAAYDAATQVQQALTVNLQGQTIKFTSTAPTNPTVGATPYTVTASATSTLPVTFSIDSSSTVGACSVSGALVTFTGAGACVIDANQAGNGTYNPAPQVQQPITVVLPASNLQVALTVGGQPFAASYTWSTTAQTGVASCTDATGLSCKLTATLDGTAVTTPASISLPTNEAGLSHTVIVTATDNAGAKLSTTYTYKVAATGYYGLTFDDGPDPTYTAPVIAALQNQSLPGLIAGPTGQPSHIPATFMLVGGNVSLYPALAQQEVNAGFGVGDHTWDHLNIGDTTDTVNPYDTLSCNGETATMTPVFGTYTSLSGGKLVMTSGVCPQFEIEDTALMIHQATGVWPAVFRPPFGDYGPYTYAGPPTLNNTANTPTLLSTVATDLAKTDPKVTAMPIAAWSTDSLDWCVANDTSTCLARNWGTAAAVAANAEQVPAGGIILMHDAQQVTVDAIPLVVNALASKGLLPGKLASTTIAQQGPWVPLPPYYVSAVAP